MPVFRSLWVTTILCSSASICFAYGQQPAGDAASLVQQAAKDNVLSTPGAPPFHAVLDIQPDPKGPQTQQGRIELFWATPEHYELKIATPEFTQHLIVDGSAVSETDLGDYYPAWLHFFVLALFNPVDRAAELLAHANSFHDQPMFAATCYQWDSRRNNVTDAEREADICFRKPLNQLSYTRDYMRYLEVSDFEPFHNKSIARKYTAGLRVGPMPSATLSILEDWTPNPSQLHFEPPTSTTRFTFHALTASEGSARIVSQPENVKWPITREGALSGKVLVNVVTDRTGKVHEAASPESDNEELKPFATELAKQYVFRPLLVSGEAVELEIPLMIDFHLDGQKPYRQFGDAETRAMVKGCKLPTQISDPASSGQTVAIQMLITEDGRINQIGSSDRRISPLVLFRQFGACHFAPYLEEGKPTPFRASFNIVAK